MKNKTTTDINIFYSTFMGKTKRGHRVIGLCGPLLQQFFLSLLESAIVSNRQLKRDDFNQE